MDESQKDPIYRRPPITEAVIEFRFETPVKKPAVERAARKLSGGRYPLSDPEEYRQVTVDIAKAQVSGLEIGWTGFKLSSADRVDLTLPRTVSFVASRLAPYAGWEQFVGRLGEDWERVKSDLGSPKVKRVGVRFINRIDIPGALSSQIDPAKFVNIGVSMPSLDMGPVTDYLLQVNRKLGVDGCTATISSGTVVSPLVGYKSITLDIDVANESTNFSNDSQLWSMLSILRNEKNRIFEASVTDQARELFR